MASQIHCLQLREYGYACVVREVVVATAVENWKTFCLRVRDVGHELMSHCGIEDATKGLKDPRVMATCVLARTLSNLLAVRTLIEAGHVVEARTVTRCCYENSFWVQGLLTGGDAFVAEMLKDEAASFKKRIEFIFKNASSALTPEGEQVLRQRLRAGKELDPTPLTPRRASQRGPLERSYLFYSHLSADSAHPSLSALMRYLEKAEEGSQRIYTVLAEPPVRQQEAEQTLTWACGAAVSVIVGVNQIYMYTPATAEIQKLGDEIVKLAGFDGAGVAQAPS
jgi:Family of unknown function (DUF5677)